MDFCIRIVMKKMQRDLDVIKLANENIPGYYTVDDYLCEKLNDLKKKYRVDTLEMALEMEAAIVEADKLVIGSKVNEIATISNNRRV